MVGRIAGSIVLGAGLSLAAVGTAQAATPAASSNYLVPVSQPSEHCTYYHHIVNGNNVGSAYGCEANASLNTYHAWVVCSGSSAQRIGPTVRKPVISGVDCPTGTHPTTGGFDRDS